jgi:hypothetical protein
MCKWQMDDPEARVKSSLSDCTCMEDLSMDLSSRHLRTYEEKESRSIFIIFLNYILFPSHFFLSFFLFSSFFLTFIFFSSYFFHFSFFFFCSSELLQHNTYIVFVRDDVMTSPPCLNDARPRA